MESEKNFPLKKLKRNCSATDPNSASISDSTDTSPTSSGSPSSLRCYNRWAPEEVGSTIVWKDISVYAIQNSVKKKINGNNDGKLKRIINNVTGAVQPGQLVALMGASGSGKSTLMSALAFRSSPNTIVQGSIFVNGRQVGPFMYRLSGFVHQDDIFVGVLTVKEHMMFMANLKLDRRTTKNEKNKIIYDLLERAGLKGSANTRIGCIGENKVLSGGEKKRLAFATELLVQPVILFCDEPTTGLDSYSAQRLVETLQDLSKSGTTIICTIHQPSSQLFAMFNEVLLLAEGRIAFMGTPTRALNFFASQGYKCPESYNPADFLIGVLASAPGCERSSQRTIQRFCDLYAVSEECQQREYIINLETHMSENGIFRNQNTRYFTRFKRPFWYQIVFCLIRRSLLTVIRDPKVQILRTVQKLAVAIMIGFCYFGTINLTQPGIQAVQGALFIAIAENSFNPMYSILIYFPQEFPLFIREKRSGIYSTFQYYFANIIAMLPGLIIEPIIFVIICYWLAGLRSTMYAFVVTAILMTIVMNVSTACGCFFSTAFNSVPLAMAVLVPFDCVLMFTSGVFVKLESLPSSVNWLQYVSWLMYANEAMTIVQWDGITNITCPTSDDNLPCIRNGTEVLEQYSFSFDNFARDIWALLFIYVIFHFLGYLFLLKRSKRD